MAILSSIKFVLKILGVMPVSVHDLPKSLQPFVSVINLIYSSFWSISLATYSITVLGFIVFEAQDFLQLVESVFFFSVICLHIISHVIVFLSIRKLLILLTDLNELVRKRSIDPLIRIIYTQANERTIELSKSLLKSGLIWAEVFLFPNAARSFITYYTTDVGPDSFQSLFPSIIPWNFKTPRGYLACIFIQYIWIHCGVFSVICLIPLFAGFSAIFEAFTLDINKNFADLNDIINDDGKNKSFKKMNQLYVKLTQIASFHAEAQGFTDRFSQIYGSLISVSFTASSFFLCSALLGLNAAIHIGISDALRFCVCLTVMMTYLIVLCLMGDDVTISFGQVQYSIWECSWYELSLKSQKLLPLILASAQKPVYIKGYMNMRCTRESLKNLFNGAVSYFMVLRKFDA